MALTDESSGQPPSGSGLPGTGSGQPPSLGPGLSGRPPGGKPGQYPAPISGPAPPSGSGLPGTGTGPMPPGGSGLPGQMHPHSSDHGSSIFGHPSTNRATASLGHAVKAAAAALSPRQRGRSGGLSHGPVER